MATNLAGVNRTKTFSTSGADTNAPYTNTGAAATLTLETTLASVDVTEAANAIQQTTNAIALALAGPGTFTFNGANTFSGGTTISGGDVVLAHGGALGTGLVTLASNGTTLEAAANVTLNGGLTVNSGVSTRLGAQAGKTLTIGGALTLTGTGQTLNFGSASDTGVVDLAPSTFTAGSTSVKLEIDGGTLVLGDSEAATLVGEAESGVAIGNGSASATLDIDGEAAFIYDLSGGSKGAIVDSGGASTLELGDVASSTFAGTIANGGGTIAVEVVADPGAVMTLTGANAYSGGTTIDSPATLRLGNGGTTGSIVGPVVILSGGTLAFDHSNDISFGGVISGAGVVEKDGSGALKLTGANASFSGTATIDSGTLALGSAPALGTAAVTFAGSSTLEAAVNAAVSSPVTVNGGVAADFAAVAGATLTLAGDVDFTGGGQSLHFGSATDAGDVDLTPTATIPTTNSGKLVVDGGTLTLGNGAAADLAGNMEGGVIVGTGTTGATLDLDGENTHLSNLSGNAQGVILNNGATATAEVVSFVSSTFAGSIRDGAGPTALETLAVPGAILTLTGANTYSGGTTLDADTEVQLGNGGTTGSIVGPVTIDGGATLAFDHSNAMTFAGAISGAGVIEKDGAGTLTLSGANASFTGAVNIESGTLALGSASALGTSEIAFAASSTLAAAVNATVSGAVGVDASVAARFSAAAGKTLTLAGDVDFTGGGQSLHFGSATDTGDVDLAPTTTIPPINTDKLVVDGGTLTLGNGPAANLAFDMQGGAIVGTGTTGARLDIDGQSAYLFNLSGDAKGIIVNSGPATTLEVANLASSTFAGSIRDGAGQIAVEEAASPGTTLTLTGANTYTGGTTVIAPATLRLGNGGTSGSIIGPVIIENGGTLAFDHSNDISFAGVISGAGGVVLSGTGAVEFTGASSFTGGVSLASGTLDLGNATAAGTGPITFSTTPAELRVEFGVAPANLVSGVLVGDSFEFVGVAADSASVNGANQLVVTEGGTTVATLQLAAAVPGVTFSTLTTSTGAFAFADASVAQYGVRAAALDGAPDGFAIFDKAAAIAGSFATLGADAKLALAVVSDNATLKLSASQAAAGAAGLSKLRNANGSAGKAAISGSATSVAAALGALVSQASHIASIAFTNATTPALSLTAAQANADAALLKKITGGWVLDVHNANGSWTTTGHGNNLIIQAVPGKDTMTGGGTSETFILKKGFGHATLVDFHNHLGGATPDSVHLQTTDFANVTVFKDDAKQSGANVVANAGNGDILTLDGMTLKMLAAAEGDFHFA